MDAPGDATLLPASTSASASTNAPVVAVLDSGIAYRDDWWGMYARAPAFDATQFAPGWDFVNGDAYPDDDNGHGTRSEERRVGKEGRSRGSPDHLKKKKNIRRE